MCRFKTNNLFRKINWVPCSSLLSCFVFGSIQCMWWVWKSMRRRDLTNLLNSSDGINESGQITRTECYPHYLNTAYILIQFYVKPVTCWCLDSVITVYGTSCFLNSTCILRDFWLGVCNVFAAATNARRGKWVSLLSLSSGLNRHLSRKTCFCGW